MVDMTINLTALIVSNQATPSNRTELTITLENSVGRLCVENCKEYNARSVHEFKVKDATDLGYKDKHKLDPDQAGKILAISCSLANPCVLFSTFQPNELSSPKLGKVPSKIECTDTPTGKSFVLTSTARVTSSVNTVLTSKLNLDESIIFDVVDRLLTLRVFDIKKRSKLDDNILQSIESYQEASKTVDMLSCYKSLYIAFEKAINADGKHRVGEDLDKKAYALTKLTKTDINIEGIRDCNNRIKHASKNSEHVDTLKEYKEKLPCLILDLKKITDRAIVSQI